MYRDKIKAKYETFSFNFRKLADFLLQRELDAAFMTATELAQHMGVDAATVVRFAQTLGYSGFREMIKEVQSVVKAELMASYTATLNAPDDASLDVPCSGCCREPSSWWPSPSIPCSTRPAWLSPTLTPSPSRMA